MWPSPFTCGCSTLRTGATMIFGDGSSSLPTSAAQHGEPTADRVRAGAEPLVRQRLPGRVVGDLVLAHQRAAGRGQGLGLPVGGGDQQHRPTGPALLGRGRQRGGDQRPHGRRRGQVEGREGTRTRVTDSLGDDRVGGEQLDESRQGHGWSLSGVQEGSRATTAFVVPIRRTSDTAEPVTRSAKRDSRLESRAEPLGQCRSVERPRRRRSDERSEPAELVTTER